MRDTRVGHAVTGERVGLLCAQQAVEEEDSLVPWPAPVSRPAQHSTNSALPPSQGQDMAAIPGRQAFPAYGWPMQSAVATHTLYAHLIGKPSHVHSQAPLRQSFAKTHLAAADRCRRCVSKQSYFTSEWRPLVTRFCRTSPVAIRRPPRQEARTSRSLSEAATRRRPLTDHPSSLPGAPAAMVDSCSVGGSCSRMQSLSIALDDAAIVQARLLQRGRSAGGHTPLGDGLL